MISHSKTIAFTITFILLLVGTVFFSKDLGTGDSLFYDSFYTLERSDGFQKYHDWFTVYSNNQPSYKKPPLQYWLTALASEAGFSDLLSLRLPSYLFFLGLLLPAGLVSYLLSDRNPWTVPATILLMVCSLKLVMVGRSGVLDAGMAFFIMLSLLTFFYAKENSKSWILCGLFSGLGAMQKAPIAILYIAIMFFVLRKKDESYKWSSLRQNKDFNRGLYLSISLSLFWPVLQTLRHGLDYIRTAIGGEMLKRFSPVGENIAEGSFLTGVGWLWKDLHVVGIVAIVCIILVLCNRRLRENHRLFALSTIIIVVAVAFLFATGSVLHSRYTVAISPLLICITVVVLSHFISWKPGVLVICAVFFGIYFGHIEKSIEKINKRPNHFRYSVTKRYIHLIDEYRNQGDYVVVDSEVTPVYGYFGTSMEPYSRYKLDRGGESLGGVINSLQQALDEEKVSLIGFTRQAYRPAMEKILGPVEVLESVNEFMVWRSQIASGTQP